MEPCKRKSPRVVTEANLSKTAEVLHNEAKCEGKVAIVNAIIFNPSGEVLVLRRSALRRFRPDCWDLPGGHVRENETLIEALRREVREETCWTLQRVLDLLAVHDWQSQLHPLRSYRQFDFVTTVVGTSKDPQFRRAEFSDYMWVSTSTLSRIQKRKTKDDEWLFTVICGAFDWLREQNEICT